MLITLPTSTNQNLLLRTYHAKKPSMLSITPAHCDLIERCRAALGGWRAFVIGIDGHPNNGKSTLGRFLAWQLGMPCVETDMFLMGDWDNYDTLGLSIQLDSRLSIDRPVIVEGVGLLRLLGKVGIEPNFLIYAREKNNEPDHSPRVAMHFRRYESEFEPLKRADYLFEWCGQAD